MVYGEVEGSLFKTEEIPPLREYASVGMTGQNCQTIPKVI